MHNKMSYEELDNRVKELEAEALEQKGLEAALLEFERKWRSLMEEQTGKLKKEILDRRRAEAKIKELKRELARRDQVIGELTIANRLLKKSSDGLL